MTKRLSWSRALFKAGAGGYTRVIGLDIGDRWIGVAVSDPGEILATPLKIIERTASARDVAAIIELIQQYQVSRVIVGLPVSMDGTIRSQAEKVKTFVEAVSACTDTVFEYRDERLSTRSAQKLRQASPGKKSALKTRDDAHAAAVILQGYLDAKRP